MGIVLPIAFAFTIAALIFTGGALVGIIYENDIPNEDFARCFPSLAGSAIIAIQGFGFFNHTCPFDCREDSEHCRQCELEISLDGLESTTFINVDPKLGLPDRKVEIQYTRNSDTPLKTLHVAVHGHRRKEFPLRFNSDDIALVGYCPGKGVPRQKCGRIIVQRFNERYFNKKRSCSKLGLKWDIDDTTKN